MNEDESFSWSRDVEYVYTAGSPYGTPVPGKVHGYIGGGGAGGSGTSTWKVDDYTKPVPKPSIVSALTALLLSVTAAMVPEDPEDPETIAFNDGLRVALVEIREHLQIHADPAT